MSEEAIIRRATESKTVSWSGSTDSNKLTIQGSSTGLQLILPAGFTGTTLTYKTLAADGVTWIPVQKAGVDVTDTVAGSASSCNVLDAANLFGLIDLKICSDQSETCTGKMLITG